MRIWFLSLTFLFISEAAHSQLHRRLVNFEWDPIEGATSYEIEIRQTNKKEAKPYSFKIKDPSWNGRLPSGRYQMKLRTFDHRSVPGDWGEGQDFDVNLENVVLKFPQPDVELPTKEEKEDEIKLVWAPVGGADSYNLEITGANGEFTKTEELTRTTYSITLPVAQRYTWKVSAKSKAGMTSDAISVSEFSLLGTKIAKPKIENPDSEFVRELKWQAPEHADRYDLAISHFNKATKKWEVKQQYRDVSEPRVPFDDKWPGGQYKVSVRAKGQMWQSSDVATAPFKVRDGERSPAAEYTALVRQSIDRVAGWYGIASYLITQIQYSSTYLETQTRTSYPAVGGTGRLGLGWFGAKTAWGFLSILDLSGFLSDGKNLTFASLEASAVWRKKLGERGEFRSNLGMYYKELPGTIGNAADQSYTHSTIATAGPHVSAEYWHSMTPKLGLQANVHMYMSLLKMKTPNDKEVEPTMSTQFGFLGSWRFNSKFTGLMGYARREDKIKYKAGDGIGSFSGTSSGGSNETNVLGDYLNFFAEYQF